MHIYWNSCGHFVTVRDERSRCMDTDGLCDGSYIALPSRSARGGRSWRVPQNQRLQQVVRGGCTRQHMAAAEFALPVLRRHRRLSSHHKAQGASATLGERRCQPAELVIMCVCCGLLPVRKLKRSPIRPYASTNTWNISCYNPRILVVLFGFC